MSLLRKTPARLLLLAGLLAGAAWLASLDFGERFTSDILELIPPTERSPELAVVRSLANEKQARVALFALNAPSDDETRDRAARAFTAALLASDAFAEAEILSDSTSRNDLAKQIFTQRLDLLLPGWLAKNEIAFPGARASRPQDNPSNGGRDARAPGDNAFAEWLAEKTAADLEHFMAKPEALAFAELIPADPLLLLPDLVEKVQTLDTAADAPADTALIWTLTRENPLHEAGQKPVFDAVDAALAAAHAVAPGATIRWAAISRFAAESKRGIMQELFVGTPLTLFVVLGIAILCLPRILGALNLAPVVFGALLGACVAVTLCFEHVHFLVFVLGLMLAGVSIDYGFYLYLQPQKTPGEPYAAKVRRLMKPLLGSALTTVLGFSLLLFSDLALIRQLGVFVSAGLLCALVTAVLWFAQIKNPNMQARAFASAQLAHTPRTRRAAIALLCAGALVALLGPWRLHWHDSTRELQPRLPRLADEAAGVRQLFGDSAARTVYLTRGETIADARASLEKFTAWHGAQFPDAAAASLGYALPLRADYDAMAARLETLRGFPDALRASLERHGFDAAEFAPFFEAWEKFSSFEREGARKARPYDDVIANLSSSLHGQTALLMADTPGASFLLTVADHPAPADDPPAALATTSLNQLESLNKLFARYRLSALRLSVIGLVLVGLSMWAIYGVRRGTLIFTTPVFSCFFTFGVLGLCGVTLNLFHLLGAFLGVCLSHNYAIFTAENDARKERPPPSIRLSAFSTAGSFGVLACSGIPVVSALGVTVALIVLSALAIVELKRAAKSEQPQQT
ncbi:putative exporter [Ereboglobus sp. PH5-5]|uniref:MMPL family transporter n=1 Tax=Ereboglobus sp. PH5-5 TaxID=2940529 RepID=UPI002406F568|nr:MMPL family transporter [Ereboglobus sp. PH5-5]MDF9833637.1 putative exporter [Ereboglobus sp. PH5-5]